MRILSTEEDKIKYKDFITNHPMCNFQASLEWGDVKTSWIKKVVLSEDENGNIIGSLMIWIRKIPLFGNIMYSPRGLICDIYDKKVVKDLADGANQIAKEYKAFVLRMEPDILKDDIDFREVIREYGFKIKDDSKDFKDEIQPRFVFRLDIKDKTEEELLANFQSKTRYNIKLATKKGVIIKECPKENLKEFHNIMVETGKRDDFIIRSLDYFERMYDCLAPEHMKLLIAYHDDKPIAGIIPIMYGNKVWYLYGASSNNYRNYMPNYLLQWTMIKEALELKADVYDFRGVSGVVDESHPQYGLYRFKKGFNAKFTEFIGEVYIAYKPIRYECYKIAEKCFRTLRKLKKKITEK